MLLVIVPPVVIPHTRGAHLSSTPRADGARDVGYSVRTHGALIEHHPEIWKCALEGRQHMHSPCATARTGSYFTVPSCRECLEDPDIVTNTLNSAEAAVYLGTPK